LYAGIDRRYNLQTLTLNLSISPWLEKTILFSISLPPRTFEKLEVPELLSHSHHGKIIQWQQEQKVLMPKSHQPDLLEMIM
jgi:hypothetical protein